MILHISWHNGLVRFFEETDPFENVTAACAGLLPGDPTGISPIPRDLLLPFFRRESSYRAARRPKSFYVCRGGRQSLRRRGAFPMPPTAGQIFAEMRLLQPAFALWTGDTIYGSDDSLGEAEAEYDTFLGLAAPAETPVYNAPGNHEIYDRPELAALYEKKMGRLVRLVRLWQHPCHCAGHRRTGNERAVSARRRWTGCKQDLGNEPQRKAYPRFYASPAVSRKKKKRAFRNRPCAMNCTKRS